MKDVKNTVLYLLIVVLAVLNMYQFYRSKNVGGQQAIVTAWNDEIFINDVSFQEFHDKVTSHEFIDSIINKRKYNSIRSKFLKSWKPKVTQQRVSNPAAPHNIYWGGERKLLTQLIDDIYAAIRPELDHYRSQTQNL